MHSKNNPAKLIVFAAPSGSGKSTIVQHLLNEFRFLAFSISATTRKPRDGERDGESYYFLDVHDFQKKIKDNAFLEYQQVYEGLFYGTLKSEIERISAKKKIAIFDVDVKGALNIKQMYGNEALLVYVKVASKEILLQRLRNRGTESEDDLKIRIKKIEEEMSYEDQFDRILLNDDLENTLREAEIMALENFKQKPWNPQ